MNSSAWPLLATTIPGLESVAVREVHELTGRKAEVRGPGQVRLSGGEDEVFHLNYRAKSLHRIFLVLGKGSAQSLGDVYAAVYGMGFPNLMHPAQPFAVRVKRRGHHDFTSMDAERTAGQAVIDAFRDRGRPRPPVCLDDPDVLVFIDIRDRDLWVGLDTTGKRSLHRRDYRIQHHPAPLRSTLAYGLIRLSRWASGESFLDPMCGSGTICIEASHWANRVPNWYRTDLAYARLPFLNQERLGRMKREADEAASDITFPIHGCDVSALRVRGAGENARHARAPCHFFQENATGIALDYDRIVTNPPFGFRMGSRKKVETLYEVFMDRLERYPWKSVVILTGRPDLLPVLKQASLFPVRIGNLAASIWVMERGSLPGVSPRAKRPSA